MIVTEKMIASAGLSPDEAKLVRYRYNLPSAGEKTRNWISNLSDGKYDQLLKSSEEKLRATNGAGN